MRWISFFILSSLCLILLLMGNPVYAQPTWEQMVYSEKEYKGEPVEIIGAVMDGKYDDIINMIFVATDSTNGIYYNANPICVWISDRNMGKAPKDGSIVKIFGSYKMVFALDEPVLGEYKVPIIEGSGIRTL